ncbi:hypothetical protein EON65_21615 [archaeon]|nr:MAG: hypothetical protein EON65_21615 [archaeon]
MDEKEELDHLDEENRLNDLNQYLNEASFPTLLDEEDGEELNKMLGFQSRNNPLDHDNSVHDDSLQIDDLQISAISPTFQSVGSNTNGRYSSLVGDSLDSNNGNHAPWNNMNMNMNMNIKPAYSLTR